MFKKGLKLIKLLFTLVTFVLIFSLLVGQYFTNKYMNISIFDALSLFFDATHTKQMQVEWSEQDKYALFDSMGKSMYLKDGVIDETTFNKIIDLLIDDIATDDYNGNLEFDSKDDKEVKSTQELLDYIFSQILTYDNIDLDRLESFEYANNLVQKVSINSNMLAAFLDSSMNLIVGSSGVYYLDELFDYISILKTQIKTDIYLIDGNNKEVTVLYTVLSIDKGNFINTVLQASELDNVDVLKKAMDVFLPKTIYIEAKIGLDYEVPVEFGINDLTVGDKYNKLKGAIEKLSTNIDSMETIDFDEIISKPINEVIIPAFSNLKQYIDVSKPQDDTIEIDLLGAMLNIAYPTDAYTIEINANQIVLALKAIYIKDKGDIPYSNWFYQLDKNGNYVLQNNDPIVYQNYNIDSIDSYKIEFAKKNIVEYRLNLQDKDDIKKEYTFNNDYNCFEDLEKLNVDYNLVFEYLMAFLNNKAPQQHNVFYNEQFEAVNIIKRFPEFLDTTDIDEAMEKVMDSIDLKFNGSEMLAITDDQVDSIFADSAFSGLNIQLTDVSIKNVIVDGTTHDTMLMGITLDIDSLVSTKDPFIDKLVDKLNIAIEVDITKGIDDTSRLPIRLFVNKLNVYESDVLLDLLIGLKVDIPLQSLKETITSRINQVITTIDSVKYFEFEFEAVIRP